MSAIDTAKEFVRIGSTVGLSKDVIDLLDKKASLLAEQVTALEQENTTLLRENRNLKLENEKLKDQLQNARTKSDELDDICKKMLVTLANADDREGITDGELIQQLGLPKAKGDHCFDQLKKRKFVGTGAGAMGRGMFWYVTSDGREYLSKAGLL